MLYSEQPTVLLAWKYLTQSFWPYRRKFWNFKFHLKHFPKNARFLSFDGLSNYLYLFKEELAWVPLKKTTDRHFRDQVNVRHPISKLLKCALVQRLNLFRDHFCGFLLPGRHLSLLIISEFSHFVLLIFYPAGIYLVKVNNRNTIKRCEICSKLTIKTPEQRQWSCFGVFIVNFEHISHLFIVFLLLTLSRYIPNG